MWNVRHLSVANSGPCLRYCLFAGGSFALYYCQCRFPFGSLHVWWVIRGDDRLIDDCLTMGPACSRAIVFIGFVRRISRSNCPVDDVACRTCWKWRHQQCAWRQRLVIASSRPAVVSRCGPLSFRRSRVFSVAVRRACWGKRRLLYCLFR